MLHFLPESAKEKTKPTMLASGFRAEFPPSRSGVSGAHEDDSSRRSRLASSPAIVPEATLGENVTDLEKEI